MTDALEPDFDKDDLDTLAAEYVLGLTPPDAQADVRLRLTRDATFAAAVAKWQQRLVGLTEDIKPKKPSRKVKNALKVRLFGRGAHASGPKLWVWQAISFAALALAAYISVTDLGVERPADPPVFAAMIENNRDGLQLIAVYDPLRDALAVRRIAGGAREGRVLEFWAIAPDAAPVSLGVLPDVETARVSLPESLALQVDLLRFAISDEPLGGSTTGVPSGDVLGVAPVHPL